jgi:hypothetical protein
LAKLEIEARDLSSYASISIEGTPLPLIDVKHGLMDIPAHCGALRKAPVIIRNPRNIDEIIFIPPESKDVR